jgi:pimeloyl-ACP methyl ester carboxylesterase
MRYSVYCSEQIAYANPHVQENQDSILPWLSGYRFNNVDNAICKCWKVRAEPAVVKTPIYSNVPTLITAGDADPWCRPFYNRLIKRTMPNSQLLIIHDRGHGAGYYVDGTDYLQLFMKHPYQKLEARSKNVVVE